MLIKCADAISIEQRSDTSDPCDLTSDLRDPKFNPRPGCPKFIVCTKFGDRGSNRFGLIEFEKTHKHHPSTDEGPACRNRIPVSAIFANVEPCYIQMWGPWPLFIFSVTFSSLTMAFYGSPCKTFLLSELQCVLSHFEH